MRTDSNCIFCKIVAGEIPCFSLWEDSETLAFMDINPANRGHALVIPKQHWEDVYTVPDVAIGAVGATAQRIAKATHAALAPDGINLVQANGPGAAQSVFHFHMHVLPRYSGDELKINWGLKPGDMDEIKTISERIMVELANL
ncbi:MAG: HIT family protein [Gammaproteobacteria bacterium]|nr:HIT family protein [Gammaproteobacteria bacterium]